MCLIRGYPCILSRLPNVSTERHAVRTLTGVLCYANDDVSGADTEKCHPIEGIFDTVFFVEWTPIPPGLWQITP